MNPVPVSKYDTKLMVKLMQSPELTDNTEIFNALLAVCIHKNRHYYSITYIEAYLWHLANVRYLVFYPNKVELVFGFTMPFRLPENLIMAVNRKLHNKITHNNKF